MQFFWKCEECDTENAYPSVKDCETCGSPMTPAAEKKVLQQIKDEEERQAQIKREEERRRREEERARQEAERKRQEAIKAAERAERERQRRLQLEREMREREAKEAKFSFIFRKTTRVLDILMKSVAVLAVVVTIVLFSQSGKKVKLDKPFKVISDNIHSEYLAHTVVKEVDIPKDDAEGEEQTDSEEGSGKKEKRVSRVLSKVNGKISSAFGGVSANIKDRFTILQSSFKPVKNIAALIKDIAEFLSGGVDK